MKSLRAHLPKFRISSDSWQVGEAIFLLSRIYGQFTPTPYTKQARLTPLFRGYQLGVFYPYNGGRLGIFIAHSSFLAYINFVNRGVSKRFAGLSILKASSEFSQGVFYWIKVVQSDDLVISFLMRLICHSRIILRIEDQGKSPARILTIVLRDQYR